MPQINLLKQTSSGHSFSPSTPKIFVWIFVAVLLGLIGYYIWLFVDESNVQTQITQTVNKMNFDKQAALDVKNRDEIFTRQQQLKALSGIINAHPYWSQLIPELAKVTLKNANYHNLSVDSSGALTLDVTVPTLDDLDKYMQVFDLPVFNENFSDLRIGGYNVVQGKNGTSLSFQVNMKFNPAIIQYKDPKNAAK